MLELVTTFTPADGGAPRAVTLRLWDVRRDAPRHENAWSAAIQLVGLGEDEPLRVCAVDWTRAIKDGANMLAGLVAAEVARAGGGTLDPPVARPEWPPEDARKEEVRTMARLVGTPLTIAEIARIHELALSRGITWEEMVVELARMGMRAVEVSPPGLPPELPANDADEPTSGPR